MGLTTAMYTGLSGIHVNQARIETIGHNLANVNTTAFKGSRTLFQTQFSRTITQGSAPSAQSGGTNPMQFGLGAVVGSNRTNFTPGSVETTGVPSDVAIEGNGFFMLERPSGMQVYTRDGAFSLDAANRLITADGDRVLGFGVDGNFGIVPGVLQGLEVPIGTLSLARPTANVLLDGDLSATGTPATEGALLVSQAFVDGGGGAAAAGTALSDLRSAGDPGVAMFANGQTITASRLTKGGREMPTQTFVVGTTGNTLGDFAAWLEDVLGIQPGAGLPGMPGVTVEGGTIVVNGNTGVENDIQIESTALLSDSAAAPLPFQFDKKAAANGTGTYTAFTVFDSLGNPMTVNVTFALESTPNTGPVWRYYAESSDNAGVARALGSGTVSFDPLGNFVSATGSEFSLDRSDSGAATPLTFTLDLSGVHGLSTETSQVILDEQDGVPPGTLANYAIGPDGTLTGIFDNGITRTLGQIALATFPNPDGLFADADNTYTVGPNSGPAAVVTAGEFGSGTLLSGALELGNVDLSEEFIGLITSSTGFQASSRVISVSSDLLDQLLLSVR